VSDITAFEALVASDSEQKIAKQAATDKLAAAIYDVREQYGAHLFCAKTMEVFHDRVALCKDDMIRTVNAHLMPVTGVMRKVCKTMEREWRERIAKGDPRDESSPDFDPVDHPDFEKEDYEGDLKDWDVHSPDMPSLGTVGDILDAKAQRQQQGPRPLHEIARDIKRNWPKVNFAAQPYLDALHELESVDDMYYQDPAKHIVNYFLSNAGTWRGPEAKRIKDELKGLVNRRASRVAYSGDELDAYREMMTNDEKPPRPKAKPFPDTDGKWEGASGNKESRRRQADTTGPVQDIDATFQPSDDDLIPEGDFHGYLDSVSQNGYDGPPSSNFTPGGDSGKHARRQANEMMGYPPTTAPAAPDASGMTPTDPAAPPPVPGTSGSGIPGAGSGAVTAAIIKRYAQWCVDNLARPSARTLEYYAVNRPDKEYFILTAALQRHAEVPGGSAPEIGGVNINNLTNPYTPPAVNPMAGTSGLFPDGMSNVKEPLDLGLMEYQARRTAAGKDYLMQADEAITNLLNEKAEEFQESIQPLQQALQTIQYAEQVQQAQNPMNVMPPAGTVNVLPQTQAPQGPAPQGVDPASGQIDPAMLAQLMGQGGVDPSAMGGAAPGGPPPAAAGQGALPPEIAQQMQMQARRRRYASQTAELIEEYKYIDPDDLKATELWDTLNHLADQGDPEAIEFLYHGIGDDGHEEEVDPAYWDGPQVHDVHGHDSLYEGRRRVAESRYFNEEGEPIIGGAEARFEDYLDQMSAEEGNYYDDDFGPEEYDEESEEEDGGEGHDDKEWMDFRASVETERGYPKG
jgi:hypothetical protein